MLSQLGALQAQAEREAAEKAEAKRRTRAGVRGGGGRSKVGGFGGGGGGGGGLPSNPLAEVRVRNGNRHAVVAAAVLGRRPSSSQRACPPASVVFDAITSPRDHAER